MYIYVNILACTVFFINIGGYFKFLQLAIYIYGEGICWTASFRAGVMFFFGNLCVV